MNLENDTNHFFVPFPVRTKGDYCNKQCRALYNPDWTKPICIVFNQKLFLSRIQAATISQPQEIRTLRCEECKTFEANIVWNETKEVKENGTK